MAVLWQALIPFLEIVLIAVIINYLLAFFWNTRAMDLISGLIVYILMFVFATLLNFPVLQTLLLYVINVAVIAILIIFQPELRIALSKLGAKGRQNRTIGEFDQFLESLSHSVYKMSDRRIGSIVVLENQDSLEDYANRSVRLDAVFSSELLESIFMTTTPLHDGAVILRGGTILSGATILPLADDARNLSKSMGTRHRAALGLSEETDALIIVVSEETGKVSLAREGIMTRGVKVDRFKGVIRSIFAPTSDTKTYRERFKKWIMQWQRT